MLSCEYCKIFKNYFEEPLWTTASVLLTIKLLIKYWTPANFFLIRNITWYGFYYEVCRSGQNIFLLTVSRNHPSRGSDIDLISGFWQIYTGCCPLHNVYFNDMQINRWQNFKDKGHLFTLNLQMTTTKIHRISLLRTFFFFLFLWINLFCSTADVV